MKIYSCGIIKLTDKIYVSVFFLFSLFFFIRGQGVLYSSLFLLSVLLHECSHVFFLVIFKAKIKRITFFPFGIDISADTKFISYKKELVCTLAGSAANMIACISGYGVLLLFPSALLLFFVLCNGFLALLNLIPLSFFDGGKAIRLIIYDCFDIDRAFCLHKWLDMFSACLFLCFSLLMITGSDFNLSVVCVTAYAAISTLIASMRAKTP